jgi:hypothetical protein
LLKRPSAIRQFQAVNLVLEGRPGWVLLEVQLAADLVADPVAGLEAEVLMPEEELALVALAHKERRRAAKVRTAKHLRTVLAGVQRAAAVACLLVGQMGSRQVQGHSDSTAALMLAEDYTERLHGAWVAAEGEQIRLAAVAGCTRSLVVAAHTGFEQMCEALIVVTKSAVGLLAEAEESAWTLEEMLAKGLQVGLGAARPRTAGLGMASSRH